MRFILALLDCHWSAMRFLSRKHRARRQLMCKSMPQRVVWLRGRQR